MTPRLLPSLCVAILAAGLTWALHLAQTLPLIGGVVAFGVIVAMIPFGGLHDAPFDDRTVMLIGAVFNALLWGSVAYLVQRIVRSQRERTMPYPPESLAAQVGRTVELRFEDGEVVHARLLAIDPDDQEDITYEVVRIITAGTRAARGTRVGATIVADLHELSEDWRLVE